MKRTKMTGMMRISPLSMSFSFCREMWSTSA
jgi:hypothetical protein